MSSLAERRASAIAALAAMPSFVTVSIRQGALRGRRRMTPGGKIFLSFEGIPYARPPLGSLRFKAPQPPEPWSGIRDATKEGSVCVHFDPLTRRLVGDEDCLVLNVFTPQLPTRPKGEAPEEEAPRAVLVWIHGGAFTTGSSNMYGPEPLMERDVVLVTINYRLGPLGFLGLGTADVPGNAGLKDQTMALRWVKDNIAVFGGDADNVTIFGESAGGASVHYHVLSPLSKGLFRRAIAQSGSALCPWALSRDAVGRAKRLAVAAGCDPTAAEDPAALLKFFRQVPAGALIEALENAKSPEERRRGLIASFVPCVEPAAAGVGAFLPDDPAAIIANGEAARVPIVFGLTSHEGILMLPESIEKLFAVGAPGDAATLRERSSKALAEVACDLERVLPDDLMAGRRDLQRQRQVCERVKDFYFDGRQLCDDTLDGFVHLMTDVQFAVGVMRAARDHAHLGCPVYVYEFAFCGGLNFLTKLLNSKVKGTCHGDELSYQFRIPGLPEPDEGSPEALVRSRLNRMWADFAKTGNPTPAIDDEITETWKPCSESSPTYLRITEDLKLESGLLIERMKFWESLYKK